MSDGKNGLPTCSAVVRLGRFPRHDPQVHRHDLQALALDAGQHLPDQPAPDRVGLDEDEGTLNQ